MKNIVQFCLNRSLHRGLSRHFRKLSAVNHVIHPNSQFGVRHQHDFRETIKNGPGLKDFVMNDGFPAPVSDETANTPYLDESDLDGQGRKG